MRVVLDTNILLSACWKPSGNEAQTVHLAVSGAVIPCVSAAVLTEYRDVLFREKFAALHRAAVRTLELLEPRFVVVEPMRALTAATDEDDNRFLECAESAGADYLITGNLRHYPAVFGRTAILNARRFLETAALLQR